MINAKRYRLVLETEIITLKFRKTNFSNFLVAKKKHKIAIHWDTLSKLKSNFRNKKNFIEVPNKQKSLSPVFSFFDHIQFVELIVYTDVNFAHDFLPTN